MDHNGLSGYSFCRHPPHRAVWTSLSKATSSLRRDEPRTDAPTATEVHSPVSFAWIKKNTTFEGLLGRLATLCAASGF